MIFGRLWLFCGLFIQVHQAKNDVKFLPKNGSGGLIKMVPFLDITWEDFWLVVIILIAGLSQVFSDKKSSGPPPDEKKTE